MVLVAAALPLRGQSVNDAIDDPIDCGTGKATAGLLPGLIDITSIEIRKQNDDLVATVEFRGDPSIGDSVSGGILALDTEGLGPGSGSDWHFDNAGNVMFSYAGDALGTKPAKFITDSTGAWVRDSTSAFTATRAGNEVIVRIPGQELGPGSLWMAYASTRLLEEVPRCDAAGNDKDGLPTLEVPQLVAAADVYTATGNVSITIPASAGVLSNDIDASSITDFDETSLGGGTVLISPDGGFVYDPAPGFIGDDLFTYTVSDGKGGVGTADVTIDVTRALWFVDASALPGPGTGTLSNPFTDLISLSGVTGTPAGPNTADAIILFEGQYQSELVLDSAQVVVGHAADVLQTLESAGFQFPPYSDLLDDLPSIGEAPLLISDSLDAIRLGQHNRIYGLSIGDTPGGAAIRGDSVATLIVSGVAINGRGAVIDVGKGQVDIALLDASSDSARSDAISLIDVEGSVVVENPVEIADPGRDGIRAIGGSVALDFPALHVAGADSGAAVNIQDSSADADFGPVEIRSVSGSGVSVVTGGDLRISGGLIETGTAALDLNSVHLDVRLDTISSAGMRGVRLDGVSGRLVVSDWASIESDGSPALNVVSSTVALAIEELTISRADSSFGISMSGNPGSVLQLGKLTLVNERGGGIEVEEAYSVLIGSGSVIARGGPAIVLGNLAAEVRLDSISVDSAETAIRLTNVGGSFEVGRDAGAGLVGTISRLSGRAIEVSNVADVSINGLQISEVGSDALNLQNFGRIRLTNLEIDDVDGTAIMASTGGLLEVLSSAMANVGAGFEIYEVDEVMLADNQILETHTTAVIVSNTAGGGSNSQVRKSAAGDMNAQIIGNEITTSAADGLMVSSSDLGVFLLELRDNQSDSSENDFVFSAAEPAVLMLTGFAGGDSDAVGMYVGRTNVGFPSVEVVGAVAAGPAGQADLAAIEKSVSDPEPLPEREIEYRIAVTNLGPAPAFAVTVVDSLPDGLGYVTGSIRIDGAVMTDDDDEDAADFGQTKTGSITARLGDMSATDTTIVTFLARPRQAGAGSAVTNVAVVEALSPDSVDANNRAEVEITIKLNTATESNDLPDSFALRQNYPNPFNPITTIDFDLPAREFVRLTVHNVLGQPVAQLISASLEAGRYSVNWDARTIGGTPAGSGMYFYTLEAGSHVSTRSMILLK